MDCPKCFKKTRVADSRPHNEQGRVYRRRFCPFCDHRFTTYEKIMTERDARDVPRVGRRKVERDMEDQLARFDVDGIIIGKRNNRAPEYL